MSGLLTQEDTAYDLNIKNLKKLQQTITVKLKAILILKNSNRT